jgi:hypothetical protein
MQAMPQQQEWPLRRALLGIEATKASSRAPLPVADMVLTRQPRLLKRCVKLLILLAGGPGFEPGLTESESAVLPLNYPPPVHRRYP